MILYIVKFNLLGNSQFPKEGILKFSLAKNKIDILNFLLSIPEVEKMNKTRNKRNKPIEILLIEDNKGDNRLTTEVFKEAEVPNNIQVVTNGIAAMEYLKRKNEFKNAVRPDLIFLDLNIPKRGGRELLIEIKEDPLLKCIPLIVLTTSNSEMDIKSTYAHYANAYITKPIDLNRFVEVIKSIEEYWLNTVELPNGCGD